MLECIKKKLLSIFTLNMCIIIIDKMYSGSLVRYVDTNIQYQLAISVVFEYYYT